MAAIGTDDELQERIRQAPSALIAARIRRARREFGTHDALAQAMAHGATRQHLIKLEKGMHRPRAEMLHRIADATGKDVGWFLDPEAVDNPFPDDA